MSNKIGLNINGDTKELKLGKSFSKGYKDESYHTIRYDFKPASVDSQKAGTLDVVDKEVILTVPTEGGGSTQSAVFKGNKTPSSKDCLLIINHDTGELVLERISENIRVKKTRTEGNKKVVQKGIPHSGSKQDKLSPMQNNSSNVAKQQSPMHKSASSKTHNTSSSMPMLNFEEETKNHSIMSDSSSDSESNSESSSSSDSESDTESESKPIKNSAGSNSAIAKNKSPSSVLSDLELSEED